MNNLEKLAEIIFPTIRFGISELEFKYKARGLKENQVVSRFAPSPTGFLHTGSLFTALIASKICKDTKGVFYIRIEDTDQKREVSGSKDLVVNELAKFLIIPKEGFFSSSLELGDYGPYVQSMRQDIYKAVIKDMIKTGLAYPCFCSEEELTRTREIQIFLKERTGYYKQYTKCRNLSALDAISKIMANEPYVIRFKSSGNHLNSYVFKDLVRGEISLTENDLDIVILKSDGLPTYHFAHVVDDHFMHSTHIIRGEEWLSSLPVHVEIFKSLDFKLPQYAHLPVIMKIDENNKRRKLSKRYDLEAAVSYFYENGYPVEAILDYLMTIANSNYEFWRTANKDATIDDFIFDFAHMSVEGAIFDLDKIKNISKNFLANLKADDMTSRVYEYAKMYNPRLKEYIEKDIDYFTSIMNIERDKASPRKDYECFNDILPLIEFFYDYQVNPTGKQVCSQSIIFDVLESFIDYLVLDTEESIWLETIKAKALELGFAKNNKELLNNPQLYHHTFSTFMEIVRYAITGKKNSPNIYYCIKILKTDEISRRIKLFLAS